MDTKKLKMEPKSDDAEPVAEDFKTKFMQGRMSGKAKFPFLEGSSSSSSGDRAKTDDELDQVKEEEGEDTRPATPKCMTWWDGHKKQAIRILPSGEQVVHAKIKKGGNGFLLAEFAEGSDFELDLTNDCEATLANQVIDPTTLRKRPAKAEHDELKKEEAEQDEVKKEVTEHDEVKKEVEDGGDEPPEPPPPAPSTEHGPRKSSSKKLKYSKEYHKKFKAMKLDGKTDLEAKAAARIHARDMVKHM